MQNYHGIVSNGNNATMEASAMEAAAASQLGLDRLLKFGTSSSSGNGQPAVATVAASISDRETHNRENGVAILSGRVVCVCGKESAAKRYNLKSIDIAILRERERSASDMEAATLRQYIPTRQRNEKTTKLEEANGSGGGEKKSVEGSAAIECFIYLRSRRRKIKIVISGRAERQVSIRLDYSFRAAAAAAAASNDFP